MKEIDLIIRNSK